MYLYIPVSLLHGAVRVVIAGEDLDEDKTDDWPFNEKFSTTTILLEILGEALPELL